MKKTKSIIARSFAAVLAASMAIPSFAGTRIDGVQGQWKNDGTGWWWQNADASYPTNQWVWLDGNDDTIAECYYFDEKGYMVVNSEVEGYKINANGQWVDASGNIQTKAVNAVSNAAAIQGSESTTSNNGYISHADLFDSNLPAHEFNALQEKYLAQTTDNWRDYLCYSYLPEWALEKYEEEGAHIYWNGEKKEMTVEWPNGRPDENDNEGEIEVTDDDSHVSDEILSVIDDFKDTYSINGRSDIEKELLILMYIARNCRYNLDSDRPHTAEGCLLDGEAVCDGYAKAFKIMAQECGLDAKYIQNKRHAWNMVKINGNWYHLDATYTDKDGSNLEKYWGEDDIDLNDVNLSDENNKKLYCHSKWDVDVTAPKTYKRSKLEEVKQQLHDEFFVTQDELDAIEERKEEEKKQEEKKELEKKNKQMWKKLKKIDKQEDEVIEERKKLYDERSKAEGEEEKERLTKEIEELDKKREELGRKWNAIYKEGTDGGYGWS